MAMSIPIPPITASEIEVRRLKIEDLRIALRQGWADYLDRRSEVIFLGLIYPAVGLIACLAIFRQNLLPLIFPLAAGFSLMGPPLASGFYELARRRERGEDAHWLRAFDLFSGPRIWPIAALTGLVAVLYFAWLGVAWAIYSVTLGSAADASSANFIPRLFTTRAGWTMIVAGDLAGLVFAAVVLAISAISFPMLVDGKVGPLTAAKTSLRAVRESPVVFATWGLIVAALLALGSIPLLVGLAVVLPTLAYATWHLYTRTVAS